MQSTGTHSSVLDGINLFTVGLQYLLSLPKLWVLLTYLLHIKLYFQGAIPALFAFLLLILKLVFTHSLTHCYTRWPFSRKEGVPGSWISACGLLQGSESGSSLKTTLLAQSKESKKREKEETTKQKKKKEKERKTGNCILFCSENCQRHLTTNS